MRGWGDFMSDSIESVGAMATAGLAAAAIEGESGHHGHSTHGACANCGTRLTGNFCHSCGQAGHLHRSMLHIVEEFFHGILHFDSKAWRTLPMLVFRPGKLTYDYIHGHRARYVTPMAMFLFSVFMMFMAFSLLGGTAKIPVVVPPTDQAQALSDLQENLEEAKTDLVSAQGELAAAEATGDPTKGLIKQRDRAARQVEKAQLALDTYKATMEAAGVAVTEANNGAMTVTNTVTAGPTSTLPEIITSELGDDLNINIGSPELNEKIKQKLKNPELLLYKMQNTAYKFSWLLIPISLPFLWLMFFWKRDVAMYDHAIFSLYSLAFMSMLFIAVSLLIKFTSNTEALIGWLIAFAPPLHMFFQLRGTYRLTNFGALWRTVALLFITLMTSITFVIFIVSMGVAG